MKSIGCLKRELNFYQFCKNTLYLLQTNTLLTFLDGESIDLLSQLHPEISSVKQHILPPISRDEFIGQQFSFI